MNTLQSTLQRLLFATIVVGVFQTTVADDQSGHMTIRQMERIRDDNLIAILHGLKGNNWGAGKTLSNHEAQLLEAANDAH